MVVRVMTWGYPTDVNQGLESDKNWYEFQLIEDRNIEMSVDDVAQLIADEAEHGHYISDVEGGTVLEAGDRTYKFSEKI